MPRTCICLSFTRLCCSPGEVTPSPPSLGSDRQLQSSTCFGRFIGMSSLCSTACFPRPTEPKTHNKRTKPTTINHQKIRLEDIPLLGRWKFCWKWKELTMLWTLLGTLQLTFPPSQVPSFHLLAFVRYQRAQLVDLRGTMQSHQNQCEAGICML